MAVLTDFGLLPRYQNKARFTKDIANVENDHATTFDMPRKVVLQRLIELF